MAARKKNINHSGEITMNRVLTMIISVALLIGARLSAQTTPANSLLGLWMSDTTFGPPLRGELSVTRSGQKWRATLGRARTESVVRGDSVLLAFSGDRGKYRGVLSRDGGKIRGFWLQPAEILGSRRNPAGTSQKFATPVTLLRTGSGTWRGTVQPLTDKFTLYLKIVSDSTGALIGAFRNPEQNSHGGANQYRVAARADSVVFTSQADTLVGSVRSDKLRIFWPDDGRVIELTKRAPRQAAAFFSRPPDDPPYVYRQPEQLRDGWMTARASDVGLDETALTQLVQKLIATDPAARRPSLIHSLLVARKGKLVLEEYFFGFNRDTPHDLRSAGKTFASIMLGATMMQGGSVTPETRLYDLLAGMGPFRNPDPKKSRVTVAHLLTHTGGFIDDDETKMQMQEEQPDWWKYTLDLPVANEPGSRYSYSSAGMNLVGAALTVGTKTWLPELFDRTIARPLQFGRYYYNLMPTDHGYLGGGAYLLPRDMLKIGQAYLDGGVWNGHRIVDSAWVTRSTSPKVEISPKTTGLTPEEFGNQYVLGQDGYAWHLNVVTAGGRSYRKYEANGNGGQAVIVVPELQLVVGFTGGNYGQGGIWGHWGNDIIGGAIIPAIR